MRDDEYEKKYGGKFVDMKTSSYDAPCGMSGHEIFDEIIGKVFTVVLPRDDTVEFITNEGQRYFMFHDQDCCESVVLQEVIGDIHHLINSTILRAERRWNEARDRDECESETWTFYEFATLQGAVTFRWYGSSNGYYSEDVSFYKLV